MKIGSRKLALALIWYCIYICIASITRSLASNHLLLLGVAPQDYKYYEDGFSSPTQKLKCKDGLKQFSKSQFNDDFCDCLDGSDEPGTSACPNGKFHCNNAGHVPLSIYSSRVNDGICDCCDGSDEYDGSVKCTNTCWEAGKAARDKLMKKIATYQQGATIRRRDVEQAEVAIAKEEAELAKLKNEEKILKGLVEQLKEKKEQIEKAEEKERLQKEKEREEEEEKERLQKEREEKERTETEEAKDPETNDGNKADISGVEPTRNQIPDQIGAVEDSSSSQDEEGDEGAVKDEEDKAGHPEEDSPHENHATEDPESLSREELGRRIASRWTGEKKEEETKDLDADSSSNHGNSENSDETGYEEGNSYESDDEEHKYDNDDEEHKYDNDDDDSEEQAEDVHDEDPIDSTSSYNSDDESFDSSDMDSSSSPSWLEKIRKTVRTILNSVNYFQGPVDLSEAEHVRKEYDESSTKLSKMQSRISSLTKKLKQDFGPDKQFHSFYGQCFEIKQNKYVYKICPFKEASQVEGYSTTRLGTWDKFEESYRAMQFSNGDKCWNGPDRSLKVKLRCGLKNEVSDVDEPSRCEYLALLATPAVCHEDKLKELEDKLEMMNTKREHQSHDEL
ncbi:protein-binding activity modulator [Lithospermum erythrorhizon]|uniref:Glucosidase 2 subunit beta n=1 Tax=Lithospermum erythrorhizon TaxID=34254 RepID=A0AAV3RDK9_LITER